MNTIIISEPRKLVIPDKSGHGNHLTMVINWSPKIKNSEYIKLVLPNREECIVQKDEFRTLMSMISSEEEAAMMGRQKIRTVKVLKGHLTITPTKKMVFEKGQTFHIPYGIPLKVPMEVLHDDDDEQIIAR